MILMVPIKTINQIIKNNVNQKITKTIYKNIKFRIS